MPLNKNLQKLTDIAQKSERYIIGLMSGTSLDGLDIALCKFSGNGLQTRVSLQQFITISYSEDFKNDIREVFAKKTVDLEKLTLLNEHIGLTHAGMILAALKSWDIYPDNIDLIASHGQTIYHAPKRLHSHQQYLNATLQIGDGDHIAVKTGIITISDFRQKHIATGGEGAPLALYGDVILGSKPEEERILLNIGGIANLTYLPANGEMSKVLCTDIGPGNTLIDAAMRQYFNKPFDEDSATAFSGKVNEPLLKALLDRPFFSEPLPKTTGPELFNLNYIASAQESSGAIGISPTNLIATLSELTVVSIANFIKEHLPHNAQIFISGGGARNPYVTGRLKELLPEAILRDSSVLGINPDAKEAILFALLANEAMCGEPLAIGNNPAVLMGKISFP